MWTWTAIDADTKLIPSWLVGERTMEDCYTFLADLRSRTQPGVRIQLTTDGFGTYPPVVDALWRNAIDYAVMVKEYGSPPEDEARRYSPATCTGIDVRIVAGRRTRTRSARVVSKGRTSPCAWGCAGSPA